ncbi:MAG: hypothetical protein AVDCRST_MAG48-611, partial [uncultured Friedmanniella sp.]
CGPARPPARGPATPGGCWPRSHPSSPSGLPSTRPPSTVATRCERVAPGWSAPGRRTTCCATPRASSRWSSSPWPRRDPPRADRTRGRR